MKKIAVIGVPSSAGARRIGQERAPQSFRRAGLIEKIRSSGLEVIDFGDLPEVTYHPDPKHPKQQNLSLVRDVATRVAEQVQLALDQQVKPIVLGGDCTITLGVLASLVNKFPNLGLLYFDGDVDLNTPEVTLSGIFDGMVIAHIIGQGAYELTHITQRYPLMPEEKILLFGYNPEAGWIDPAEIQRLDHSSMLKYPITQVRGNLNEAPRDALAQLEDRVEQYLVHFDVDVIDFSDLPAADVPHEQGFGFVEAMEILSIFVSSPKFAGLVITEFNAERDEDGILAQRLVNGVANSLEEGYKYW
ncbi:MAG: arginase family protein [Anaerolineales bacterium]|jgi:arginase